MDLFDTTHYDTDETNYTETQINYSEHRVNLLNVRKFDIEKDLGITRKEGMLDDFRRAGEALAQGLMLFPV